MYKILANSLFLGKQIVYMPTCHSTNDTAREHVRNTATIEGAVFITDDQTQGKGQRGNSWEAKPGENLTFSVVLTPTFLKADKQFFLNIIASLAVNDTIETFLPNDQVLVKWPNDVYLNGGKVAGILVENAFQGSRLSSTVVGIGLNVNQLSFKVNTATSLAKEAGSAFGLEEVLHSLLMNLEKYYLQLKREQYDLLKEAYYGKLLGYAQTRKYLAEYEFEGKITRVEDSGYLIIESKQGEHRFDFKEVQFLF